MTAERELKLVADVDTVLPDFNEVSPGVTCAPSVHKEMAANYYDTPTLSLARWGVTLRWRNEDPVPMWTVKPPARVKESILSRQELNFVGPVTRMPRGVAELVRVFRRGQTLDVVANLRTARTETPLLIDGLPIATVCDDRVSGDGGTHGPVSFREIEVELAPGAHAESMLSAINSLLITAGCRVEEPPLAKVIRVLGAPAELPPDIVVTDVTDRASISELVISVLSGSVDQLIRHDPGTRTGEDPEDLHKFRVAARRLRSDLGTFSALFDPEWTRHLRDDLKWIANQAGVVRDADVLHARFDGRFAELPLVDVAPSRRLLKQLENERASARSGLLAALSTDRYDALIEALISAAHEPRFVHDRPTSAGQPTRRVVSDLVAKRWRRLHHGGRTLVPDSPDEDLHEVRILAKRCRYAAEAASKVCGRDARRFGAAIADVQEVLGHHQDTVVAEAWLRVATKAIPSTGLVAGLAIAQERSERVTHRQEFASAWAKATRRSLRSWLH